MEAAAADDEGCGAPIRSATTNWIAAAGGSLGGAISFDTSEEIENEEAKPVLLRRPEGDDPPPCEITICFEKKHEIHRVYVRSTARVYEIYYSPDRKGNDDEYLCTVRCGAAVRELVPQSSNIEIEATAARPDQDVMSNSSNSNEDGWVQVKPPDSLPQDEKGSTLSEKSDNGMDSPKMQIHYEATAEISDYSPCASLTLRLLSIQTKDCVHIEEIYIYADLVDSSDSEPPDIGRESLGGSSFLAMLVPSLMKVPNPVLRWPRPLSEEDYQQGAKKTDSSGMINTEASSSDSSDQKTGRVEEQSEIKLNFERVESEQTHGVKVPDRRSDSLDDQSTEQAYIRIEKVLDNLVSKVERVEAFCSKFEEKMLRPLGSMEQRLEQLEQKLDGLAAGSQCSKQCLCFSISHSDANRGDSPKQHVEQMEDKSKIATASPRDELEPYAVEPDTHSGLEAKAPEVLNKDDFSDSEKTLDSIMEDFPKSKLLDSTSSMATTTPTYEVEPSVLASETHRGLVITAPEFLNDEDNSDTEETLEPPAEDLPINRKPLSIDDALASSLAAFLMSTAPSGPNLTHSKTTALQESVDENDSSLDSVVVVPSEDDNLSDRSVIEENGSGFLGEARNKPCFDDSLSHEAAIVNDELSADEVPEGTAFGYSLLIADADALSPGLPSKADSGFIAMPPEFLFGPSSHNCDDTLESSGAHDIEDRQTVSPLAEYLSSKVVQSPKVPALFKAPSWLSGSDSSDLSETAVALPSEGAELVPLNPYDEETKDEFFAKLIWSTVPCKFSLPDDHVEQVKTGVLEQNLLESTSSELDAEVSQNCIVDSNTNNNRWQEAVVHGFGEYRTTVTHAPSNPNQEPEETICNVKFSSERNWISGLPLELLLGETDGVNTSADGDDGRVMTRSGTCMTSYHLRVL